MAMTDLRAAKWCADALQALGEPHRIQIIDLLRTGPKNVGEITKALKIPIVNASHHLKILRQAQLVVNTKDGRHVIYTLDPKFAVGKNGMILDVGWCKVEISG